MFSEKQCKSIISLTDQYENTSSSKIFSSDYRKYSYWIIPFSDDNLWIFNKLNSHVESNYPYFVKKNIDVIFIHKYTKGQEFEKHSDQPNVILSVGAALNNDYEGGEFVLYSPDEVLEKRTGLIYSINTSRPHKVNKILEGERWSLISFYYKDNLQYKNKSPLI